LKDHYKGKDQVVDKRVDEDGNPRLLKQGPLYERFYYDALLHKSREGYLYQKIQDPRSYDYNRIRSWTDRSRMPQFKFARLKKKPAETPEDFKEANRREAVMTFVLGLVAEPIALQYVNQPTGERLAEIKGRQVLDKFNCAGCHVLRPGVFDFKLTAKGAANLYGQFAKNVED